MEPLSLTTPEHEVGGRTVVCVRGDVDLASADRLREALDQALTRSNSILVDVADMSFIDSSGLSALVWGHRRAAEAGGSLTLHRPSPMLRRLLELTRLDTVLVIDQDDRDPDRPSES